MNNYQEKFDIMVQSSIEHHLLLELNKRGVTMKDIMEGKRNVIVGHYQPTKSGKFTKSYLLDGKECVLQVIHEGGKVEIKYPKKEERKAA